MFITLIFFHLFLQNKIKIYNFFKLTIKSVTLKWVGNKFKMSYQSSITAWNTSLSSSAWSMSLFRW
jgi:hypothetical protein